jgi:peptide/nickel transport system substrate-binding protein
MARPFPDMPYWASFPAIGPIPRDGSSPDTYGRHPLSTGPYMFEPSNPEGSLTLVRNPYWDASTDPGRHAYPDRYVFRARDTADEIDATLLGSSPQAATMVSNFTLTKNFAKARRLGRLAVGARPCTNIASPDYRTITDTRVRQAIAYAYPYKRAAQVASGISDNWRQIVPTSGTALLAPGFPGRPDYNVLATPPGTTDPAKARALLKEAGYEPGQFTLTWPYASDYNIDAAVTPLVARAFTAAGFKARPFATSRATLGSIARDPRSPFNLPFNGWCSDWWSGSTWFPFLFQRAPAASAIGFGDFAFFDQPTVDSEIRRIEALPLGEQPDAWGALDETIATKYFPIFVTGYQRVGFLHGSRIGGASLDAISSEPTWRDLYVK